MRSNWHSLFRPPPTFSPFLPSLTRPSQVTVSHKTSLCCLLTPQLSVHHIHNRLCKFCTAGSGYSSKHKHTSITQMGSCRELRFTCACCWCMRVCVCVGMYHRQQCYCLVTGPVIVSTSELEHRGVTD